MIGLVGCGKGKQQRAVPARDLYTGTLFKLARRYAERRCSAWFILSAEHGLVRPEKLLRPYETSMKSLTPAGRVEWAAKVRRELQAAIGDVPVLFLAGSDYAAAVAGREVSDPLRGMSIGRRLQWLKKELGS